jgi:hypothetical protein
VGAALDDAPSRELQKLLVRLFIAGLFSEARVNGGRHIAQGRNFQ